MIRTMTTMTMSPDNFADQTSSICSSPLPHSRPGHYSSSTAIVARDNTKCGEICGIALPFTHPRFRAQLLPFILFLFLRYCILSLRPLYEYLCIGQIYLAGIPTSVHTYACTWVHTPRHIEVLYSYLHAYIHSLILSTRILLFSSCIRNTVAIQVLEGVSEFFEISKIWCH